MQNPKMSEPSRLRGGLWPTPLLYNTNVGRVVTLHTSGALIPAPRPWSRPISGRSCVSDCQLGALSRTRSDRTGIRDSYPQLRIVTHSYPARRSNSYPPNASPAAFPQPLPDSCVLQAFSHQPFAAGLQAMIADAARRHSVSRYVFHMFVGASCWRSSRRGGNIPTCVAQTQAGTSN